MSDPDKTPYPVVMRANHPALLHVRPRYPRAWVVGIEFSAEARSLGLRINRINIGGQEQLRVWPLPVEVFRHAHGFVFDIVQATSGITLELWSHVDQTVDVAIAFTECKLRAPVDYEFERAFTASLDAPCPCGSRLSSLECARFNGPMVNGVHTQ